MKNIAYTVSTDNDAKNLVYEFNLAGKAREDVRVSLKNKQIHLFVNNANYVVDPQHDNWYIYEQFVQNDNPLNFGQIKASMKNGLLTVKIPLAVEEEKPISID